MYDVYINHYQSGQEISDDEVLMFSVPTSSGFPVSKPIVKAGEDYADNLSFTMDMNSPYYNALLPLKTTLRVEYDGDIIFDGRVLMINTQSVYHTKNVTCEGYFSYMKDTMYEGKQEKHRENITVAEYYQKIIDNHNTNAPGKSITIGTIGVTLPTEKQKYEPSAWSQTSSLVSNLASNYGGHMKVRSQNGTHYLDWYKYYARDLGDDNRPHVTIGKNILDISSDQSIDGIFTRLIPIGGNDSSGKAVYIDSYRYTDKNGQEHTHSGKVFPIGLIRDLYTDEQLTDEFHDWKDYRDAESKYGTIYKTMQFSDATTQEKLWDLTKKWVKDCYFGLVTSFTVKAIDMYVQDMESPKILIGDCVDVNYLIMRDGTPVWETKKLVCKNIQYDLFNPDNNSYTFGIPSDMLEHNRERTKSAGKAASASVGKSVVPKNDEDNELTWRKIWLMIGDRDGVDHPDYEGTACYDSFGANGELSGTVTCYDPAEITDGHPMLHDDLWFEARLVGKITLQGKTTKWVAVSESRGIFAYVNNNSAVKPVTHWYVKKSGYEYKGKEPELSTFEKIARMIENDPDSTYGGSTAAQQFRTSGNISGSVNCYDPEVTNNPSVYPEYLFSASIVGQIGTAGNRTYIGVSGEYGIFAYKYPVAYVPNTYPYVVHWYQQSSGSSFDNKEAVFTDSNGNFYTTDNDSPEGKKTVSFQPKEINTINGVQVSEGKAFVGYDLTSQEDKWKIGLNLPIVYNDAEGVQRTADGFVSASDFNIDSIPSFKTKLAIVDVLIAGKVDAVEIEADIAYVRDLAGDVIKAGTSVRSAFGYFTNAYVSNFYATGGIYYTNQNAQNIDIKKCYNQCLITESGGVITLTMYPADGSAPRQGYDITSFNMAATQFYQDAIAAAKDLGWNSSRAIVSDSFPKSNTEQSVPNTNWILKLPKTGFNSGSDDYNVSVSGLTDYTYSGATMKVYNIKIGDYIAYRKIVPLQNKGTITPGTSDQTLTPSSGYDGISRVVIEGDSDLTAGNIKKDVTIFGVKGSYEPALQDKGTITPSTSDQTITPSSNYYGISKVIVSGDGDLTAGNIKKDVTIFGVTGDYEAEPSLEDKGTVTPGTSDQTITPGSGYDGISKVIVAGDSDLTAGNIKKDVTIFGVKGTYVPSVTPSTDIQIGSYTNTSDEPSYGTVATNMHDTILACIQNRNWFSFKVTINGVSGEKYYKMKF